MKLTIIKKLNLYLFSINDKIEMYPERDSLHRHYLPLIVFSG